MCKLRAPETKIERNGLNGCSPREMGSARQQGGRVAAARVQKGSGALCARRHARSVRRVGNAPRRHMEPGLTIMALLSARAARNNT
jgi:hypothetical protein